MIHHGDFLKYRFVIELQSFENKNPFLPMSLNIASI